ncbi:MAG: hypothetical protein AB7Q97_01920 [Gammaproteobacteria bacterium]
MTDLYSRSGRSDPSGKCTEEVKAKVAETEKEEITALAVLNGMSVSEYLRDLIRLHLYGHLSAIRMTRRPGAPEGQE